MGTTSAMVMRKGLPVDAPSPVPVSKLMQVWGNLLDTLEGIDDNVVYDITPQHDITPG